MMQIAEDAIDQRLIPWELFNAIVFILYSGLFYGGAVYAYRAVTGWPAGTQFAAKTVLKLIPQRRTRCGCLRKSGFRYCPV